MIKNIILGLLIALNIFLALFAFVQMQEAEVQKYKSEEILTKAIQQSEMVEQQRLLLIEKEKELQACKNQ